jgi:hypothetical protein
MTDLDLDRLGDLWRQRPTAEEMESVRRTAETVRRKARWAQWIDSAAAVLVATIVLVLVLSNPSFDTMLVGGAAIVVLLLSQARTRRLRAEELRSLTGSTQEMLDQSIARARATLKRTRFQLLAMGPSFALGLGVAALVDRNSGEFYGRLFFESGMALWIVGGAVLVLGLIAFGFNRSMNTTRGELSRLEVLREAYKTEGSPSSEEETV